MTSSQEFCQHFQNHLESYFAASLKQYGFAFATCDCAHDGRECVALYTAQNQQVLFTLSDGSFTLWFGNPSAQFPGQNWIEWDGSSGWYALAALTEFKTGKRVYTQKLIHQVWNGEIDQYQFEADLFARWADVFLPMFAPGQEVTWRDEFRDHLDRRTQKNQRLV